MAHRLLDALARRTTARRLTPRRLPWAPSPSRPSARDRCDAGRRHKRATRDASAACQRGRSPEDTHPAFRRTDAADVAFRHALARGPRAARRPRQVVGADRSPARIPIRCNAEEARSTGSPSRSGSRSAPLAATTATATLNVGNPAPRRMTGICSVATRADRRRAPSQSPRDTLSATIPPKQLEESGLSWPKEPRPPLSRASTSTSSPPRRRGLATASIRPSAPTTTSSLRPPSTSWRKTRGPSAPSAMRMPISGVH